MLVRMSYFPNWKVEGADGPYRVGPNLMVVIPTDTHVELRYGWTPVDVLSYLLTLIGIVGAVWLSRQPPIDVRRRPRRESEPEPETAGEGSASDEPARAGEATSGERSERDEQNSRVAPNST
jgi:hypothetical protein